MDPSIFESKAFRKLVFRVVVVAIGVLLFYLFYRWLKNSPIRDVKSSTMQMIRGVPEVTYANVPQDMTYGEFFDQTTKKQKWKTFPSGYLQCVELNAVSNNGKEICIQFLHDIPDYASIDDEQVDPMSFFSILYNEHK